MWEGEDGESSNRAELTVAERRDAVLPTLAWAPEGWGCEGANEAPSRTSAGLRWLGGVGVQSGVVRGRGRASEATGRGGEGGG